MRLRSHLVVLHITSPQRSENGPSLSDDCPETALHYSETAMPAANCFKTGTPPAWRVLKSICMVQGCYHECTTVLATLQGGQNGEGDKAGKCNAALKPKCVPWMV
eukprot:200829-Chlamydomonas_euryale.AAC.1